MLAAVDEMSLGHSSHSVAALPDVQAV